MEDWTNEETGVVAAIDAGIQEEKGTYALLVKAEILKNKIIKVYNI